MIKPRFIRRYMSIAIKAAYRQFLVLFRKPGIETRIKFYQRNSFGVSPTLTAKDVDGCQYMPAEEYRIAYYLGDIDRNKVSIDIDSWEPLPTAPQPGRVNLVDYEYLHQAAVSNSIKDGYSLPLLNLFRLLPEQYKTRKFLFRWGDSWGKSPHNGVISKTRGCDDNAITLLKLNPKRHWKQIRQVSRLDSEYRQKKAMAIWRGTTTGSRKTVGKRCDLVDKFHTNNEHFDVGYSHARHPEKTSADHIKGKKTLEELLQYKFLICLEGNDVASGLKWMLHCNSVVMMPTPCVRSWAMEDTLEPFVHYIPLANDFSDAEERFDWAMSHETECIEISKNASQLINQFLDPRREVLIECAVLKRFLDNINYN